MPSMYKRLQTLKRYGIAVRRASHFEEARTEYGEKLTWVVDLGGQQQSTHVHATKAAAVAAAECYIDE